MKLREIIGEAISSPRRKIRADIEKNKRLFLGQTKPAGIAKLIATIFPGVTSNLKHSGSIKASYNPIDDEIEVGNRTWNNPDFSKVYPQLSPKFARRDWDEFADNLTDSLAHEMIHKDQYSRRRGSVDIKDYLDKYLKQTQRMGKGYLSHRDEITAHAEEIAAILLKKHKTADRALASIKHDVKNATIDQSVIDMGDDIGEKEIAYDNDTLNRYLSAFAKGDKNRKRLLKQVVSYLHELN